MTSSHLPRDPKIVRYMVLSSRDRRFGQRRDSLVKTICESAAACVSLSNSTMSKIPIGSRQPHCLAPVVGGGGYLVRADPLVNQAFQPFCFFRNRSFEGRSKPPGKPRGYPSTQSSDSIEARKLTDPTNRGKKLFQAPAPTKTPKTPSPKPAGPARLRARRRYTSAPSDWQ